MQLWPYEDFTGSDPINISEEFIAEKSITSDDNFTGCILQVDLRSLDSMKEKTKRFPLCLEFKISSQEEFTDYMLANKPKFYAPCNKLICDETV